jgi:hypothetical protein
MIALIHQFLTSTGSGEPVVFHGSVCFVSGHLHVGDGLPAAHKTIPDESPTNLLILPGTHTAATLISRAQMGPKFEQQVSLAGISSVRQAVPRDLEKLPSPWPYSLQVIDRPATNDSLEGKHGRPFLNYVGRAHYTFRWRPRRQLAIHQSGSYRFRGESSIHHCQ